jgi:hypothetical protein
MFVALRMSFIAGDYLKEGITKPLTFITGALISLGVIGSLFSIPGTFELSRWRDGRCGVGRPPALLAV